MGKGTAIWVPLDVTKQEEWPVAIKVIEDTFGPLDVLCNKSVYFGSRRPRFGL